MVIMNPYPKTAAHTPSQPKSRGDHGGRRNWLKERAGERCWRGESDIEWRLHIISSVACPKNSPSPFELGAVTMRRARRNPGKFTSSKSHAAVLRRRNRFRPAFTR